MTHGTHGAHRTSGAHETFGTNLSQVSCRMKQVVAILLSFFRIIIDTVAVSTVLIYYSLYSQYF